jgi:hypothetical protein
MKERAEPVLSEAEGSRPFANAATTKRGPPNWDAAAYSRPLPPVCHAESRHATGSRRIAGLVEASPTTPTTFLTTRAPLPSRQLHAPWRQRPVASFPRKRGQFRDKSRSQPSKYPSRWVRFPKRTHRIFHTFFNATSLCGEYCVINFFKNRWVRFAETYIGPPLGFDEGLGRDALLRVHARFTHPFPLES